MISLFSSLYAKIGLGLAVLLLVVGGYVYLTKAEEKDDRLNQEVGVQKERAEATAVVVTRVEEAVKAREEVRDEIRNPTGSSHVYELCLQSNRGDAENCKRFLPTRQEDKP
jgi:hypothetical protein